MSRKWNFLSLLWDASETALESNSRLVMVIFASRLIVIALRNSFYVIFYLILSLICSFAFRKTFPIVLARFSETDDDDDDDDNNLRR